MIFNRALKYFNGTLLISSTLLITSCGLLGSKNKPTVNSDVSVGNGCLNDTTGLISKYVAGDMTQAEWKSSFDCINDSLKFFTEYVRGTSQDSYSQSDMYTLVSHFLITNNTVKPELMTSAFYLKAALFGGDTNSFTKDEVALLQTSLTRLRDITGDLIPYLQLRKNPNPSYADLLGMVTAFKTAGDQLADFINTLPTNALSSQAVASLITQLTTSLNLPLVPNLNDQVFLTKWLVFNSRPDAIEAADWAQVFKTAMSASGVLLAFKASLGSDPNAAQAQFGTRIQNDYRFREFVWQLALEAKTYLESSLASHDGAIPFPLFDHLIDVLPADSLGGMTPDHFKTAIRPVFNEVFQSTTKIGLDQGMIDTIFNLGSKWVQSTGQLDRFYEATGTNTLEVTPTAMTTAMNNYESSLNSSDRAVFDQVKTTVLTYQPLFSKDTGRVLFEAGVGYSHYQNFVAVTLEPAVQLLEKAYASNPGYFIADDLNAIFDKYHDILLDLKLIDATAGYGAKRLQDIDLFTSISNGDQQATQNEIVNYAMLVMSAGLLGNDMRAAIHCGENLGIDEMGWNYVSASCFRTYFNDHLTNWLDYFPHLKAYWASLSAADQQQAMIWLEHGAREKGYTQDAFGRYDIQAMATVLHYTESLFRRFDINSNEILSKSEVNNAYPVFKKLLASKSSALGSSDFLGKGAFSYIVRYRSMPDTDNVGDIAKLAWWLAIYSLPTTDYSANRVGVFNIVCQLADPVDGSPAATKAICQ